MVISPYHTKIQIIPATYEILKKSNIYGDDILFLCYNEIV